MILIKLCLWEKEESRPNRLIIMSLMVDTLGKKFPFFSITETVFFCLAFFDLFSESEKGKERYDAVKSTLDEKYGVGRDIQYGVMYGNPEGKCISLVVLPLQDAGYTVCGLYYLDEKIYQTDTASAIDEL